MSLHNSFIVVGHVLGMVCVYLFVLVDELIMWVKFNATIFLYFHNRVKLWTH